MLGKKLCSMKKLAGSKNANNEAPSQYHDQCCSLLRDGGGGSSPTTPTGTFPVYVGEARQRFVVPTSYVAHPLFKIMLDKAYNEFGFEQRNGLVIPCTVAAFRQVITAVECSNASFDFGQLLDEFIN